MAKISFELNGETSGLAHFVSGDRRGEFAWTADWVDKRMEILGQSIRWISPVEELLPFKEAWSTAQELANEYQIFVSVEYGNDVAEFFEPRAVDEAQ